MPIECPYVLLSCDTVSYQLDETERLATSASARWTAGHIVVGELARATYGVVLCSAAEADTVDTDLPPPVLSTVIDDHIMYSCDEEVLTVILKTTSSPGGFPRITLRFSDPFDFFEMARTLYDAKYNIAFERENYKAMLSVLHREECARSSSVSTNATTSNNIIAPHRLLTRRVAAITTQSTVATTSISGEPED
ncbi:hypothetical protein ACG7TL_001519 [Trametes sanguinea]